MAQTNPVTCPQAIDFIVAMFGPTTECPVFFQTLANDKGDADEAAFSRQVLTREPDKLVRFIVKHDRNRRGLFFCMATLAEGSATRNKTTVRETAAFHADLDFKNIVETGPEIIAVLERLRLPLSARVRSGGGVHVYLFLKEGMDTQAEMERIESILKRLAWLLGGDPAVCEVSRLMRVPGTHNSKYGDMREVVCEVLEPERRYEVDEIEAWLAEETQPLLTRKVQDALKVVGGTSTRTARAASTPEVASNPFLAAGERYGYRPPIDVEAALNAMGPGNIHITQRDVSASLIKHGHDPERVIAMLLEVTQRAAGPTAARWNWKVEERKIRKLTESAVKKYPPRDGAYVDDDAASPDDDSVELPPPPKPPSDAGGGGDAPDEVGAARVKRKPKPTALHIVIAEAVLAVMQQRGENLMFTPQRDYHYFDGMWHAIEDDKILVAWLNRLIEEAGKGLKLETTMKLVSEARAYILRAPELHKRDIPFDRHGMVSTRSGLVNSRTGELIPPEQSHYVTWRIEHDYVPEATCPWWLQMLEDVFADRSPASRALHIQLLQEMLGLGLIDDKSKALSRALIFVGASNYGKSGLIDVMAGLFGSKFNTTSLATLSGENEHRTVAFAKRDPWVLNEAFDSGQWHLSSLVKTIISGEPIPINVKRGRQFSTSYTGFIVWGSNAPPQFKEATEAIVNRIVVVECLRKFDEDVPVGAGIEARRMGFQEPSELVLATEMEGVLAWAIEGLRRVLARGVLVLPQESKAAAEQVRMSSNMVAEFIRDCITFNPNGMVSSPDFVASHTSWWSEHKSDQRGAPGSEKIGLALRALNDARIAADSKELRTNTRRYYAGISLNAEGLRHWQNTVSSTAFVFASKTASTSSPSDNPNQPIPSVWDSRASILAMREAQAKSVTRSKSQPVTRDSSSRDGSGGDETVTEPVTETVTEEQVVETSKKPLF